MRNKRPQKFSRETLQRWHAIGRMGERYGLFITREEYQRILDSIQDRCIYPDIRAEHLAKLSNTRSWWRIIYKGVEMSAIYDNKRHELNTVLPCGATPWNI